MVNFAQEDSLNFRWIKLTHMTAPSGFYCQVLITQRSLRW